LGTRRTIPRQPARLREIFELNVGKPQPGGGSLTDPSLIRPGWVLELPARAAQRVPDLQRADHRHERPGQGRARGAGTATASRAGATAFTQRVRGEAGSPRWVRHEHDRSHAPPAVAGTRQLCRGSRRAPVWSRRLDLLPRWRSGRRRARAHASPARLPTSTAHRRLVRPRLDTPAPLARLLRPVKLM